MPDNNIYGVDFIARCMAGEALEKAGQKSWTLVAGNNISIQSDEEEKTETISAEIEVDDALSSTSTNPVQNKVIYDALQNVEIDVDNALSTTSENPVQNKVITAALKTKPTSVLPDGTVISDQKIMALTRAQYNAIQNKDPNTYYMITDDPVPEQTVYRTAYVDKTENIQNTTLEGMPAFQIPVPADFEALDVSFNFSGQATSGEWTVGCENYVHTFRVLPTDTRIRSSLQITMIEGHSVPGNTDLRMMGDVSSVRYYAQYDSTHNTVTIAISVPFLAQADETAITDNTTNAEWTTLTMNKIGYVAYGADNINVTTGLTAGAGIDMTNDVISVDMPVGSSINVTVDPSTYVLTATLYDQNTVPISTASVDLPLESMVVSGTYDDTTKSVILTLQSGQTISFSVADLVSGLETSTHAAQTYQTIAGMSNYLTTATASTTYQPIGSYATTNDISDMATQTWVGQQGFLTSADEVPAVTSSDDGKVLTADYTGGTGSYSWEAVPTPADMATQTWVGQQGYLTTIPYATQTTKGGVRVWTTVEQGETVLNISNEDPV